MTLQRQLSNNYFPIFFIYYIGTAEVFYFFEACAISVYIKDNTVIIIFAICQGRNTYRTILSVTRIPGRADGNS
jgi:hypothetical protein